MSYKRKPTAAYKLSGDKLTSESIQEHTKAFLNSGGEIQYISPGVSGQTNAPGRKHIVLANQVKK